MKLSPGNPEHPDKKIILFGNPYAVVSRQSWQPWQEDYLIRQPNKLSPDNRDNPDKKIILFDNPMKLCPDNCDNPDKSWQGIYKHPENM